MEVNWKNWEEEVLKSDVLVAVDFWHEQCAWCLRFNPVFEEVSKEYEGKAKFVKLNIMADDENQRIAFKYGILGTPTVAFFCKERPVEVVVGFQPKERLRNLVNNVIANHEECIKRSSGLPTQPKT